MPVTLSTSVTLGGKSFSQNRSLLAESELTRERSINKAYSGVLTTRTDDDTGVISVAPSGSGSGANFSVGDRVDVYWEVGGVKGHRRGMKVSSKSGDSITVGTGSGDVGVGDNLPPATSSVILAKSVEMEFRFDGDDLVTLVVHSEARSIIVFADSDGNELYFVHLPLDSQTSLWYKDGGVANPLAGDTVSKVFVSHSETSSSRTIKLGAATN